MARRRGTSTARAGVPTKTDKASGFLDILRSHLGRIRGLEGAFLFGSETGDPGILLVGRISSEDLNSTMKGLERSLGREVNYLRFSPEELSMRCKVRDPFVACVLDKSIELLRNDPGGRGR